MKRILLTLAVCFYSHCMLAQGFLGLGTTDLAKKKIESIELVITGAEKLSPSSTFKLGLIARDKKNREFKTYGMEDGDYPFDKNYEIAIENAVLNDWGVVTVNPVNLLNGDKIKISIKFKSNPALNAERELDINYEGPIFANFRGKAGVNATAGSTGQGYTSKNPNGQRGQDAGDNAEDGETGKKLEGYAWIEKVGGVDFLQVVVKDNSGGDIHYYRTKAAGAKITIDASGGKGGDGANGGTGGAGNKDKGGLGGNGGRGSNGADGGTGGSIVLAFHENAKDYMSAITLVNEGGAGGYRGAGGNGGYGVNKSVKGTDGNFGRRGAAGPAPQKAVRSSDLKWYK